MASKVIKIEKNELDCMFSECITSPHKLCGRVLIAHRRNYNQAHSYSIRLSLVLKL